jgi:hypothetical protein
MTSNFLGDADDNLRVEVTREKCVNLRENRAKVRPTFLATKKQNKPKSEGRRDRLRMQLIRPARAVPPSPAFWFLASGPSRGRCWARTTHVTPWQQLGRWPPPPHLPSGGDAHTPGAFAFLLARYISASEAETHEHLRPKRAAVQTCRCSRRAWAAGRGPRPRGPPSAPRPTRPRFSATPALSPRCLCLLSARTRYLPKISDGICMKNLLKNSR